MHYNCNKTWFLEKRDHPTKWTYYVQQKGILWFSPKKVLCFIWHSDSFTILGLWVLGLAVPNINESQLQTYESKTLFLMKSLQYNCILGLARTRWNKNLRAKDAGCAGNKITDDMWFLQLQRDNFAQTILTAFLSSADFFQKQLFEKLSLWGTVSVT